MLPKDPIMLASVLNTKLRDLYPDLETLCDREDVDISEIKETLAKAELTYNKEKNRVE